MQYKFFLLLCCPIYPLLEFLFEHRTVDDRRGFYAPVCVRREDAGLRRRSGVEYGRLAAAFRTAAGGLPFGRDGVSCGVRFAASG